MIAEDLQNWYNVCIRERTSDIKRHYSAEDCIMLIERTSQAEEQRNAAKKELAFRDFAQARTSDIALNYGSYDEIQKSLSSEIALHEAWTKRALEAEAERDAAQPRVKELEAELALSDKVRLEWQQAVYAEQAKVTNLIAEKVELEAQVERLTRPVTYGECEAVLGKPKTQRESDVLMESRTVAERIIAARAAELKRETKPAE